MSVLSDPISDFLTRLKNASNARREEFTAPYSNIKAEIGRLLQDEGYIWSCETQGEGKNKELKIKVKYTPNGKPVLSDVKRCSKPGRRQYVDSTEIPRVLSGLGIAIVSTSRGVMSGAQARKQNIGGELIALVW